MRGRKALNGEIELLRLLMAAEIALFHGVGGGGYLAVDFFFMLSGCFAARRAERHPGAGCREAAAWTLAKFARIYPYVLPVCAVHLLLRGAIAGLGAAGTLRSLLYESFQIGLLSASGLFSGSHNFLSHLWYLSCLMMLLPVFYSLLLRRREAFLYVLAPLCVLFCYGYCARAYGNILLSHEWNGFLLLGMIRAWAGLCMGACVSLAADRLAALPPLTRAGRALLAAIELCGLAGACAYMASDAMGMLDFLAIALLALLAAIALSARSAVHAALDRVGRLFPFGEFSLALYASHWTIPMLMRARTPEAPLPALPYLLCCLGYALLWMLLVRLMRGLHLGRRLRALLFLPK